MTLTSRTVEELDEMKEQEDLRKLEAVLFVSGKFLSLAELVSFTDLNPLALKTLLKKLQERYENGDSAIEIVQKDDLWKMDIRQEYLGLTTRLASGAEEFTMAEQETLALIAYKQPIKQSVIVKIRGNKAYDHIHKFVKLGLVAAKKAGHTNILLLSNEFYDYFNVEKQNFKESQLNTPFSTA
jgi:segregation and condensation protein B